MEGIFYSDSMRIAISEIPHLLGEEDSVLEKSYSCGDILELDELKTYFVRFYGEHVPEFVSRLTSIKNSACFVREYPNNVFEISFNNYSGMTRFGQLNVWIKSKKIPEELYNSMLNYIVLKYANLVFSFNTPLGRSYEKARPGTDIAYIEYLFLKMYLLENSPDIDGIASLILRNPHMKLHFEYSMSPIEKVSFLEPGTLFKTLLKTDSFTALPPYHLLNRTNLAQSLARRTGKSIFPTQVMTQYKHHTVDTNENRFVKHFLGLVQHRLGSLAVSMKGISGTYLNREIEKNIEKISKKIDMFMKDPLWEDVAPMTFIPSNSQVLQRREGYKQIFSLYSLLQLCTRCDFDPDDFRNLLETKDTPTLFEYWSFFHVKDILDSEKRLVECRSIITDDQKEQKIHVGIAITYADDIILFFNKHYAGISGYMPRDYFTAPNTTNESYSHGLRPDIVIKKGESILIFDAKYKGKGRNGSFYGEDEQGGVSQWKDEDIDKMHTYREAIKNVAGAFILYPGERPVMYPAHDAKRLHEGVGAIPLKPTPGGVPFDGHLDDIRKIINDFINEA